MKQPIDALPEPYEDDDDDVDSPFGIGMILVLVGLFIGIVGIVFWLFI